MNYSRVCCRACGDCQRKNTSGRSPKYGARGGCMLVPTITSTFWSAAVAPHCPHKTCTMQHWAYTLRWYWLAPRAQGNCHTSRSDRNRADGSSGTYSSGRGRKSREAGRHRSSGTPCSPREDSCRTQQSPARRHAVARSYYAWWPKYRVGVRNLTPRHPPSVVR